MEFRVTILGSGTGVPWRGRSSPGLALSVESDCGSHLALVDPSAGTSQRLVARGYPIERLTHVLFSHYHPDHTGDLAPLLFALKNPNLRCVGSSVPLQAIGPAGLLRLHRALGDVYGGWIDVGERLELRELGADGDAAFFRIGPIEVTWHSVAHTDTSVAYRFESRDRKVFTYSGDTDSCEGIVEASRGADVLVLDCAFPEGRKHEGHLVPSEAGRIAAAAGVRKLILTHFYPECWNEDLLGPCREYFDGEVSLAEDGLTVNL